MFKRDERGTLHNGFVLTPMKLLTPLRFGLALLLTGAGIVRSSAQTPAGPVLVEVDNVRFDSNIRGLNPGDNWYEIAIEVDAKPDKPKGTNRHVNRVRATLSLGIEGVGADGQPGFTFYRASAEAVAIEQGKSVFRFYLPPEVVKRDNIRGDAKFYAVDIEAEGKPQPPSRKSVSSSFTAASLQSFISRVSSEAGANDGILQPQYLTPFAFASGKPAPTIIRTER